MGEDQKQFFDKRSGRPDEIKRGTILHRYSVPSKGIQMLRLERKLKPILERWRAAVQQDPKAWK